MSASYGTFGLYRRLLLEARPCWPQVVVLFLLGLAATPLALLLPVPIKITVDSILGSQPLPGFVEWMLPESMPRTVVPLLMFAAGFVIVVGFLTYLQQMLVWVLTTYTGERLVLNLRSKLFLHFQRLSLSYHDAKGSTDSLYRIQYDATGIQYFVIETMLPVLSSLVTVAGTLYVIWLIHWQLAVVALGVCPVLFLLTYSSHKPIRRRWLKVKEIESAAMTVVQEALSALRVVKAFGREEHEDRRFTDRSNLSVRGHTLVALMCAVIGLLVGLTTAVGTAAVLVIGVFHVQSGAVTLGELLVVLAYIAMLFKPLETLSNKFVEVQSALASAERTFTLLDRETDVPERPNARPVARAKGAIAFDNVSFGFGPERPALSGISFAVPAGARVGILGPTGAGKTTLVSLLFRFYDPAAGRILLDGADLRDYRLADLRNQIAIMLQEPVLFSASIADNIAYARPGASQDEVVAAAKAASAHDFITRLPQGYATPVGERGMMLSGGERQRISLARAFLRDAPILILDEPTSSVDVGTETLIMQATEELMRGRTTFMIAHRLGTLKGCDVLLRLEGGRLAEVIRPEAAAAQ
ncbi:MAG TPA: ABC transporter ATP-binding protein [Alphaproteobacteria bacterium]